MSFRNLGVNLTLNPQVVVVFFFLPFLKSWSWVNRSEVLSLCSKLDRLTCSLVGQKPVWECYAVCVRPEWLIVGLGFFHARCSALTENKRQMVPSRGKFFRDSTFGIELRSVRSHWSIPCITFNIEFVLLVSFVTSANTPPKIHTHENI